MTPPTTYTSALAHAAAVVTAPITITIAVASGLVSPVVVTPSDSAAGGTFTPATVTISGVILSATTVYTAPGTAKTVTISTTNGGGLTDPANLTLTVLAPNAGDNTVALSWSAVAGAAGYDIEVNGQRVDGTASTTYALNMATVPQRAAVTTTVTVRVSAYTSTGNGKSVLASGSASFTMVPSVGSAALTLA